jgi:hypothetical protein
VHRAKETSEAKVKVLLFGYCAGMSLRSTIRYLGKHHSLVEQLGLMETPSIWTMKEFVQQRLGVQRLDELKSRFADLMIADRMTLRPFVGEHRRKPRLVNIPKRFRKEYVNTVYRWTLHQMRQNPEIKSRYSNLDVVNVLMHVATGNMTVHSFTLDARDNVGSYARDEVPCDKTVFNRVRLLYANDQDHLELQRENVQRTFEFIQAHCSQKLRNAELDLAIDEVSIQSFEEDDARKTKRPHPDPDSLVPDAHLKQKGTVKCRRYIVLTIAVQGRQFVIAYLPVRHSQLSFLAKQVDKLLLFARGFFAFHAVHIGVVLMDRFYEKEDVLATLIDKHHLFYLMPSIRRENVVAIGAQAEKAVTITDRILNGRKLGKLVVLKTPTGKPLEYDTRYYTTNLPVTEETAPLLEERYRRRWVIETNFNSIKQFLIKTTTRDTDMRTFFFSLAVVAFNFWVLANLTAIVLYFHGIFPEHMPITKKQLHKSIWENGYKPPDPP